MNTVLLKTETPAPNLPPQKKKREELSLCNVMFCLLVVFIHVSAEPVTLYLKDSILYILTLSCWRLASFVVQGFLFLSGVKLFLNSDPEGFSYPKFFLSRLKRVVLPYIGAFCLFFLYFALCSAVEVSVPAFLRHLFIGDLTSHFYFVIIICQFYLLMPLWRQMARTGSALIALPVSLILMMILKQYLPELLRVLFGVENFAHNSRLFTSYVFYFVLGVFCGLSYDSFLAHLRKQKKAVIALWTVTALVNCIFIYWNSTGKYYAGWLDNFHILYSFLSVLLFLLVSDRLTETEHPLLQRGVRLLDRASYHIYLVHPLFIFGIDRLMGMAGLQSVSLRYLFRFLAVYALTAGMCLLWKIPARRR